MKKLHIFLPLLAFLLAFLPSVAFSQEVEVEFVGKLGGIATALEKRAIGETDFDLGGGTQLSALFRFDQGIAVGLDFNWSMINQRIDYSQLTYSLGLRDREFRVQHPSFGVTFRKSWEDIVDFGLWINYGFGSAKLDYDAGQMETAAAEAFGFISKNGRPANIAWNLQSLELGLLLHFAWRIPAVPSLAIIIGLQVFADFSRMRGADSTMADARAISGDSLDEMAMYTGGFFVTFGARYGFGF